MTSKQGVTVICPVNGRLKHFTTESLQIYATCFRRYFEKYKNCAIGIAMRQSPAFVAAVLETLKQEIPFVYLQTDPLKYAWTMAERFCVSAIISDCKFEGSAMFEEIKVFDDAFYFYDLKRCPLSEMFDTNDCVFVYGAQTSGTTGEPKTVYVPRKCIDSNIKDMSKTFLSHGNGFIFWGTHPSFDPSILELLLAIETNSTLIIPPSNWDQPGGTPVPECFDSEDFKVDFMQTTPTKLMMFPKERIKWIFKKDSPIKNLLIGGELFPVTFLNHVISPQSTVRVFNIYGVTEVSCWATLSSAIKFPCTKLETSIGSNMSDTEVEIDDDGKIYIKSKIRECVLNFKWNGKKYFTGDFGYTVNGEVFVSGRVTQKRKGLKPSNEVQDYVLKTYSSKFNVINVLKSERFSALVVVLLPNGEERRSFDSVEETIKKDIRALFPIQIQPNWIMVIFNDDLKATKNGKMDVEAIIAEKLSSKSTLQLLQDFQIDMSLPPETPLFTLGLDSLRYLELASLVQPILAKVFPSVADFLNHIRNPKFTLGNLSRFVFLNLKENKFVESEIIFVPEIQRQEFEQQTFKTDACVEVSVIEMGGNEKFFVFGSFAGDIYTVKPDGSVMDKKYVGSQIEVPALNFRNRCAFILYFWRLNDANFSAANNGRICKINNNGKIDFFVKLPGGIRCPLISDSDYIYVITTEKHLWRVHYSTGHSEAIWLNTSCRGTPLIHNKFIYIPGLTEFVIVDTESFLILNHLEIPNPMFADAFLWKGFIVGICAPGDIILANKENQIFSGGESPPASEAPLILDQKNDEFDIWVFGGYFRSLLFTKVYCKNSTIIIESLKRLIFPNATGIINIPINIENKFWAVSCNRCHVFFFPIKSFNTILEKEDSMKAEDAISTVLCPDNSSFVQPMFYRASSSGGALIFSTRNDSIVLMNITTLLDNL